MNAAGSAPLKNTKHEHFAQLIAQGAFQSEAFTQVGYKHDDSHARRLARNGPVRDRIAFLKALAAEHTVVTLESLINDAKRIMKAAEAEKQLGPAVGALKELGILCGFRVEKREQRVTTTPDELSDDELRAIAALARPQLQLTAVTKEGTEQNGQDTANAA